MAFKPYCNQRQTWHTEIEGHVAADVTYRQGCKLVRSVGMDVIDGLAFTFSCTDYPDWVREMNGWAVEDAAKTISEHTP